MIDVCLCHLEVNIETKSQVIDGNMIKQNTLFSKLQ